MLEFLTDWYKTRFSDPQAITLMFIIIGIGLALYFGAGLLAPLLVALVLAFLLEWPVAQMSRLRISRTAAATIVLLVFLSLMLILMLGLVPSIWRQGVSLVTDLPSMIDKGMLIVREFSADYPKFVS
ncbi:MAG: putative permease, partial [Shewanella psychromarinicola]|uniref:AI-2E family transporter n=1 Tax=Shewanella psychromarinicola TaxID=2487742 RepID=UPI003EEEB397